VNDVEKLNQVIGSLEENAERVSEFNGVVASVNEARIEIEASKEILKHSSAEHQNISANTDLKFDELLKKMENINQKMIMMEKKQDKFIQNMSDGDILTLERYKEGHKASDAAINEKMRGLEQKIDDANLVHRTSLKALNFITIFGIRLRPVFSDTSDS
jgi:hypothetical protein